MGDPLVSVILPVRDGARFVEQAVDSVLRQTWRSLELHVIDDGSVDDTPHLLARLTDARVRVHRFDAGRGIAAALNHGLDVAQGPYIARMDADDIALPERLAAQVALLEADGRVGVCGTWVRTFGGRVRVHRYPAEHARIVSMLLHEGHALAHPSVMFRRDAIGGVRYADDFSHAEDYHLWSVLASRTRFANVPRVLQLLRSHPLQVSVRHAAVQRACARRLRARFACLAHPELVPVVERLFAGEAVDLSQAAHVIETLIEHAGPAAVHDLDRYVAMLGQQWLRACLRSGRLDSLRLTPPSVRRRAVMALLAWLREAVIRLARGRG